MSFTPEQQTKFELFPGDVLVSEGSASADAVGAPSEYQGEIEGRVCFQNTLLRFRAVPGVTTAAFTSHWCSWAYESGAFRDAANGTNIKHIGSRGAAKMLVPALSVDAQEALTNELDAAQNASEAHYKLVDSLRTLRTDLLTDLISGEHEIPMSYDSLLDGVELAAMV